MLKVVVVNLRGDESLALMDILIWLKVLLQVQQFEVLIATLIFLIFKTPIIRNTPNK